MRRLLLVAILLFPSSTFAKTHEEPFDAPCPRVWDAIHQVLLYSGKYGLLFENKDDMAASYNIGGFLGGKRTNSVHLKANGRGCTMIVQTAFSGLAHNDAGDFVKRVTEALGQIPAPNSSAGGSSGNAPQTPVSAAPTTAAPGAPNPESSHQPRAPTEAAKPADPSKPAATPASSSRTLSKVDIVDLLKGDVPSARVTSLVKERNINFTPTQDDYKEIRAAGGGEDLINVLKAEVILNQASK